MTLLGRLDFIGTDDRWRKPRTGVCFLCGDPVIDHPCLKHRARALWALLLSR